VIDCRVGRIKSKNSRGAGLFDIKVVESDGRASISWTKKESWQEWASLPTIGGVFATFSVFYDHASSQAVSHRLTHQQPKSEIDPVIDAKLRKLTEKTVEKVA